MKNNDEPKIWVTVSETVNTGAYESVKIEAGYSKSYKKGDNPNDLIDKGIDSLREVVKTKAKQIRKKSKNK